MIDILDGDVTNSDFNVDSSEIGFIGCIKFWNVQTTNVVVDGSNVGGHLFNTNGGYFDNNNFDITNNDIGLYLC